MHLSNLPWRDLPLHRRIWALSLPIMVSNVSVPLTGIVDTAVVGHLDDAAYIGAVAAGGIIFSFLFWGFGFLRLSTSGLVAQALGAGNRTAGLEVLSRALVMAVVVSVALLALQGVIAAAAFALLGASESVETHARTYFDIRIWSAPATMLGYAIRGWFLGRQRTGITLAIQLCLNGTNIGLSILFVLGFGWGIVGVAWATVIAEFVALAFGGAVLWRTLPGRAALPWRRALADWPALVRLTVMNGDIFVRTFCLALSFAWFTDASARQGDTILAANAILLNFQTLMAYALDGFSDSTEVLVGEKVGAGDRAGFIAVLTIASLWAVLFSALFGLFYGIAGGVLIDLMTSLTEVAAVARAYLPWTVAMPIVAVCSFILDGVYVGATWTRDIRNAMMLSTALFVVAAIAFGAWFGNHGLWLAMTLFMAMRGASLAWRLPRLVAGIGPGTP